MSENSDSKLHAEQLNTLNRTGYPLQIALAHLIRKQGQKGFAGWRLLYEEHSWKNNDDGHEGFVDLVLEHDAQQAVLAIECKRLQNKEWIFLAPNGKVNARRHAKGLLVMRKNGRVTANSPSWANHALEPATPEATFCVMRGDSRDPSIEKIGAELVSAIEAIAEEERFYLNARGGESTRTYFAVIVTTSALTVTGFDPGEISTEDGSLQSSAKFHPTPVVRLTKQLSTAPANIQSSLSYGTEAEAYANAKERTVFVVQATELLKFLRDFAVDGRDAGRIAKNAARQ